MTRVIICVILMAIVTYIPRALPITVFRKKIKPKYVRSFLDYTPYAVVGDRPFRTYFIRQVTVSLLRPVLWRQSFWDILREALWRLRLRRLRWSMWRRCCW